MVDGLERDVARLTGELARAKQEISTLRADKDAQRQTILNMEKEIGRLQFELSEANEAKAKAESEIERLRQDFEQMKTNGNKGADHA
jgi:chromosome segregation ATPase